MAAEAETGTIVTAGVEALSILANKQKTKHFLESRIQADLSAASSISAGSSPNHTPTHTPPRSSRMSAPGPLSPPPGFDDPGSELAPGWRRSAGGGPPETRIAREIREQRDREEELRRLRAAAGPVSPGQDEPLSGYGSEDKDSLAEDIDSSGRGVASHPLSRSQESLSSGHSSGLSWDHTAETAGRRRVTVRPYEDQQDGQQWTSYARSAETPIEREIRLTRDREEEQRREQALRAPKAVSGSSSRQQVQSRQPSAAATTQSRRPAGPAGPTPEPTPGPTDDHRQAALRLATGRVQHEIQEATRRELELRGEGHTITTSEETVDDKVTRLGDMTEHSKQLTSGRQQRTESAPRPQLTASRPVSRPVTRPVTQTPPVAPPAAAGARVQPTFRSASASAGRGLMQKFISSRGKLRTAATFAAPAPQNPPKACGPSGPSGPSPPEARRLSPPRARRVSPPRARRVSPPRARHGPVSAAAPQQRRLQTSWSLDNPAVTSGQQNVDRRSSGSAGNRRIPTAEEKIQMELKVMKEREEELRRERTWALARSQPDLLAALEESDYEEDMAPAPGPLTRTMSNPNLVDDQEQMSGGLANGRRRSVLIDQWESRIQGAET